MWVYLKKSSSITCHINFSLCIAYIYIYTPIHIVVILKGSWHIDLYKVYKSDNKLQVFSIFMYYMEMY